MTNASRATELEQELLASQQACCCTSFFAALVSVAWLTRLYCCHTSCSAAISAEFLLCVDQNRSESSDFCWINNIQTDNTAGHLFVSWLKSSLFLANKQPNAQPSRLALGPATPLGCSRVAAGNTVGVYSSVFCHMCYIDVCFNHSWPAHFKLFRLQG